MLFEIQNFASASQNTASALLINKIKYGSAAARQGNSASFINNKYLRSQGVCLEVWLYHNHIFS
jgi:hypothetical protein